MVITVTVEGLEYVKLADYEESEKAHDQVCDMLYNLAFMIGQQKFDSKNHAGDHFDAVRHYLGKVKDFEKDANAFWRVNTGKFDGDELCVETWTNFFIASFPNMVNGKAHIEKVLRSIVNAVLDRFIKDTKALKEDVQIAKARYENLRKLTRLLATEAFGEENG